MIDQLFNDKVLTEEQYKAIIDTSNEVLCLQHVQDQVNPEPWRFGLPA